MTVNAIVQLTLYCGLLVAVAKPLGAYMARVHQGEARIAQRVLGPLERGIYRLLRIDAKEEMTWKTYASATITFNVIGTASPDPLQRILLDPDLQRDPVPYAGLLVQTIPPWRPQKALRSAVELMYVTGVTSSTSISSARSDHAASTASRSAMSAMLQPADMSGRYTDPSSRERTSAVSAMKWTPQKTIERQSRLSAASWLSFKLSPRRSAKRITSSC